VSVKIHGWAGVISDTHIPQRASALPPRIFDIFEGASLIIHAGDLVEERVITELEALAPVVAVAGNMDPFYLYQRLGNHNIIDLNGLKVGIVHGKGRGEATKQWVYNTFSSRGFDGVVFGHLHQPVLEYRENLWLLNPGSPTDPRGEGPSCGRLWEEGGNLKAEIIPIKQV